MMLSYVGSQRQCCNSSTNLVEDIKLSPSNPIIVVLCTGNVMSCSSVRVLSSDSQQWQKRGHQYLGHILCLPPSQHQYDGHALSLSHSLHFVALSSLRLLLSPPVLTWIWCCHPGLSCGHEIPGPAGSSSFQVSDRVVV